MNLNSVSELKLTYKNRITAKDRIQIMKAQDAFDVFWSAWHIQVMEHIEEKKMLLQDRSNRALGFVSIYNESLDLQFLDHLIISAGKEFRSLNDM